MSLKKTCLSTWGQKSRRALGGYLILLITTNQSLFLGHICEKSSPSCKYSLKFIKLKIIKKKNWSDRVLATNIDIIVDTRYIILNHSFIFLATYWNQI
jgi:hypothetical protein